MVARKIMDFSDLFDQLKPYLLSPKFMPNGTIESFCPIHESDGRHKRRSFQISRTFPPKCWAGCDRDQILDTLLGPNRDKSPGRSSAKLAQSPRNQPQPQGPLGQPVAVYQYKDEHGKVIAEKARFEPNGSKTFRFRVPPAQQWGMLAPLLEKDLPLYGTERVANTSTSEPVYYVEGEKAADTCTTKNLIAVTHVGGADQQDFGDALEVLRGRTVRLWPDNDEAGRRCMELLSSRLRGIAKRVTFVTPNLPLKQKGDAADYFSLPNASVSALESDIIEQPVTHILDHDAVAVRVASPLGPVTFTFREIEKIGRSFEAELELTIKGQEEEPYYQRLNLLSATAQESLRRSLESLYGGGRGSDKTIPWTQLINTSIAKARQTHLGQELAKRADSIIDPGPQQFLINPLLPRNAATVMFSQGGSGKTYIAMALMVAVANGWWFLDLDSQAGPVLYIDYETDEFTWRRRLRRIYAGYGIDYVPPSPHFYWPGRGLPIVDQIDRIKNFCDREGIVMIVTDSAAAACGGKPEDAETTLRYFSALAKIPNTTTLTIAHVPKGQSPDAPFGSAFWRNQPRRLWYLAAPEEEDSPVKEVGMVCRKVNDGVLPRPFGVRIIFDGDDGKVEFQACNISNNQEVQQRRPLKNRIYDVLTQPMTPGQICTLLGLEDKYMPSIAATLRNNRGTLFEAPQGLGGKGNAQLWSRKV